MKETLKQRTKVSSHTDKTIRLNKEMDHFISKSKIRYRLSGTSVFISTAVYKEYDYECEWSIYELR